MKKIIYFAPATLALLLYCILGFINSFTNISPWVWLWIALMFVSSFALLKGKWYGSIGGILVGCISVYMSTQDTGQIIDIELPIGILLILYFLACGIVEYKRASQ